MSNKRARLVLATGNPGKLAEISAIMAPRGWQVQPQSDFFSEEAEETGLTFIENAVLKARFASEHSGLPAMADDSGLEVSALQGEPGIYSARYSADAAGSMVSDASNLQKLLQKMRTVPNTARQASYYCAMVLVRHAADPTPLIGLGQWHGEILKAPLGDGGFGYDPVFWLPELQQTAAQLPKDQKNQISHRAQALQALLTQL